MTLWLFRRALALYPRDFQRDFAAQMEQVFCDRCRRARTRQGWPGVAVLLAREVFNVTRHAIAERWSASGISAGRPRGRGQRERKGENVLENFLRDIGYTMRTLARAPGFSAIVIGTLSLAIGANTAIFSVVKTVLLTPPPFDSPEQLVMVWEQNFPRSRARNVVNPQNFTAWRERNQLFEDMAATFTSSRNLTGEGDPQRVRVSLVTTELFSLLRAGPLMGRVFVPDEIEPGNNLVVVLGHGFWQRQFGADVDVIGRPLMLNAEAYEIIGVMPADFDYPEETELWTPLALGDRWRSHGGRFHEAIARLNPGVTARQAQAEMDGIARGLVEERPDFNTGWGVNVVPLQEQIAGGIRPALLVMLGAVLFVLLIACANVANLLLCRAAGRSKEIAIRAALGAGRGRLVRQLLTESGVLTAASLLLGLGLAYGAIQALVSFAPGDIPRLDLIQIDVPVLGFSLALAAFTGMAFGLVPALHVSKTDVQSSLKEGGRTSAGSSGHHRLRSGLVVTEIAMALVLLVGAGLLIRSFQRLLEVDLGFDSRNVWTASVQLPGARYPTGTQQIAFFDQVIDGIEQLPQVEAASAISYLPLGGLGSATSYTADDRPPPPDGQAPVADVRAVHHNYFATMRIPVLQGRVFDGTEREDAEVFPIVISQAMAQTMWPEQDPIGKTITMPWGVDMHGEVIGVVADVRHMGLETAPRSKIYWSNTQFQFPFMFFVARTNVDPIGITAAAKEQVWIVDPDIPVSNIRTMDDRLGSSNAQRRFNMQLLGAFAAVALILACVGIYGVMSYSVAQRSHELGLRMALGAQPTQLRKMVLGKGMLLTTVAVGFGLAVAFGVTRAMTSLLFGVSAVDPVTFIGVALLLTGVAMAACWLPAHRATRVDPIVALRSE